MLAHLCSLRKKLYQRVQNSCDENGLEGTRNRKYHNNKCQNVVDFERQNKQPYLSQKPGRVESERKPIGKVLIKQLKFESLSTK